MPEIIASVDVGSSQTTWYLGVAGTRQEKQRRKFSERKKLERLKKEMKFKVIIDNDFAIAILYKNMQDKTLLRVFK